MSRGRALDPLGDLSARKFGTVTEKLENREGKVEIESLRLANAMEFDLKRSNAKGAFELFLISVPFFCFR